MKKRTHIFTKSLFLITLLLGGAVSWNPFLQFYRSGKIPVQTELPGSKSGKDTSKAFIVNIGPKQFFRAPSNGIFLYTGEAFYSVCVIRFQKDENIRKALSDSQLHSGSLQRLIAYQPLSFSSDDPHSFHV